MGNNKRERGYLKHFSGKILLKDVSSSLTEEEEKFELEHLTTFLQEKPDLLLLEQFVKLELPNNVMFAVAKLCWLLCHNGDLAAVFPPNFHDSIVEFMDPATDGLDFTTQVLDTVCLELKEVFRLVKHDLNLCRIVCVFVSSLLADIQDIHRNDHQAEEASPIPGTFNPPCGTCYYFTEEGLQQRKIPSYSLVDKSSTTDVCTKLYPQVSYGGFGYLLAFFCPIHGHSYGFHLIAGGEGRKDVFAALYKFCRIPPQHIFYDFACQLSEFCNNREPSYFQATRFWHDIFYGFNHTTCGSTYKSIRVASMEGINSEICE